MPLSKQDAQIQFKRNKTKRQSCPRKTAATSLQAASSITGNRPRATVAYLKDEACMQILDLP